MLNYGKRMLTYASLATVLFTTPLIFDAGRQALNTFFNKEDRNLAQIVEQNSENWFVGSSYAKENVDKRSELIKKGFDFQIEKKYAESIKCYDEAISLDKEYPTGYVNISSAYSMWAESIQQTNPEKAQELYTLSNNYAIIALEKLKANKSGHSEKDIMALTSVVYETLGFNYKLNGDKKKAIEFLELSLKFKYNKLVDDTLKELRGN